MSRNIDKKDKTKNSLLHKIKVDKAVGHLYSQNEKFITQRIDDFVSTDGSTYEPAAIDEFNQSLRRDIHATAVIPKKPIRHGTYKIHPGQVPGETPGNVPHRQTKERPQDVVDFMFRKQDETRSTYRKERKEAQEKANNRQLDEYVPPVSLYAPPIQFYDKHRPYFQEYIRYRNELNPVVMPVFTLVKGSIRDLAKSSFMPIPDPNKVAKRDQLSEAWVAKVREEEKEAHKIKQMIRAKKQKETQRLKEERQMNLLASPIKSCRARPSTGFRSDRSTEFSGSGSGGYSSSRPGTCNSFSPAALTQNSRPNYPTAGTIWITDV